LLALICINAFCGLHTQSEEFFNIVYVFILWCELHVKRNLNLVYGGDSVGLMCLISQIVYDGGCHVLGYVHKEKRTLRYFLVSLIIDDIVSSFVCFFFSFYPSLHVQDHSKSSCLSRYLSFHLNNLFHNL